MSVGAAAGRVWLLLALGVGAAVAGEVQRAAVCLLVLAALGQVVPPFVVPLLGLRLTALAVGAPRLAVRGQVRGVLVSVGWPWPGVAYWYTGGWRSPRRSALVFLTPLLLDALAVLAGLAAGAASGPGWGRSLAGAAATLLMVNGLPWTAEDGRSAPLTGALRAVRRPPEAGGVLGFDEADDLVADGRTEEVRRHAAALLDASPSWQAHELAALAAEYDGRPDAAAAHVRAAMAAAPEDEHPELARWEAELLLQHDERAQRGEALEPGQASVRDAVDLAAISTAAPHHLGQALLTRARVRAAGGHLSAARRDVDLADRLLPHHPRVDLVREQVLQSAGG